MNVVQQVIEAADFVRGQWPTTPRAGIILGSGLGNFAEQVAAECVLPYHDIPHFPRSTAVGHKGQLVCGQVAGLPVVVMQGRFHGYEGYGLGPVTLPVRVMHRLGIELLVVSNAAGGMNPHFQMGDVMVIDDHIHLMNDNPLIGLNDPEYGPRFPDMSRPYDPQLIDRALEIARQNDFVAHRGVYIAMNGPTYETRAEYRFLRRIGGDCAGMSTVPEVIVANQLGIRVLAMSTVTNVCLPDKLTQTSGDAVVAAAKSAEKKLRTIVLGVLADLGAGIGDQGSGRKR